MKPIQVIDSSEESEDEDVPHVVASSTNQEEKMRKNLKKLAAEEEEEVVVPKKRAKSRPLPVPEEEEESSQDPMEGTSGGRLEDVHLNNSAQKAMAMLEKICNTLDIKWQGANIQPDNAIWSKIGGIFMRKCHPDFRLTFSNYDSFNNQIGRFVAAMIYAKSDLEPKFVPGGVYVWNHGWFDSDMPRCLHGMEMSIKPRTMELNPSSEAGKRALGEQNGTIEKNRFGRQVVVLRYENNAVCFKDANHTGFPHPHAHGSCGMVFSDHEKALSAMKHDAQWTRALYPNADAKKTEECILLCVSCSCNYATETPIAGRQVCRMTAYKLSGIEDITQDMLKTRKDMKAHKTYPHTMVFTCCNPQSPNASVGRAGVSKKNEKTCGWRISAMDLRYAFVFAKEIFSNVFKTTQNANLTQFKWNDSFAFKTDVITPAEPLQSEDPFA